MNYQGTTQSLSSEFISWGSKSYRYRLNNGNRESEIQRNHHQFSYLYMYNGGAGPIRHGAQCSCLACVAL